MTYVKIVHTSLTPTEVKVYCNQVTTSWRNNTDKKPNANGTTAVEINTKSFENPTYRLQGVHFKLSDTTSLQYAQLISLSKLKYDGTNAPVLKVNYGSGTGYNLVGSDGTSTSIKVIIDSWDFPLDVSSSLNANVPIGSISLTETK